MKVVRFFPESDMRNGHAGLFSIAKKAGVDMRTLGPGEYVIFVNNQKNKVKMFAGHQVMAYLRLDKGTLDLRTIAHIPNYFEGGEIKYEKALLKVLEKEFKTEI